VKIHLAHDNKRLMDIITGEEINVAIRKDYEVIFEVEMEPVVYRMFSIS
jgi:hypothetical protein